MALGVNFVNRIELLADILTCYWACFWGDSFAVGRGDAQCRSLMLAKLPIKNS